MKIKHILFLLALIPTAAQPANRSSDIAQAIAQRFYSQLRPDARRSASDSILPVMEAIQWNQLTPYNNDCPISSTYQERCATGCVATAMAQIMKYYEWPPEGVGQKSYSLTITETDTTISEIFDGTFYDWANMQNHYNGTQTAIQQAAVAKLMYHCGVAAEMNYGIASQGGSGASVRNAGLGLLNHFNYDDALHLIHRMHFDSDDWTERILQELRNKRPILYSGIADSGVGHAFVMDGFVEENGIKTPFYTRDSLNNHLMVTFLGNTATIETSTSSNDSLTQLTTITQNTRPTQAEVYDLTGKRLLQASDPEHLRIDRLPTGFYLLRTRTIKGEQTSKFYKP